MFCNQVTIGIHNRIRVPLCDQLYMKANQDILIRLENHLFFPINGLVQAQFGREMDRLVRKE